MAVLEATTLAGFILMQPLPASVPDPPSPATLRATLADPVSAGFVEADQGTPKVLEGPFSAQSYADYFQTDQKTRDALVASLTSEGFLAGYARSWYKLGSRIFLGESVLAFQASTGAKSALQLSKLQYATSPTFRSFEDLSNIPQSFAVTVHDADGFNWTVILFVKGNDAYAVIEGSDSDYMTSSALAQARSAYDFAPPSTSATTSHPSALASSLAFSTALVVSLLVLAAIGSVIGVSILIFHNARNPGPMEGPKPQTFTLPPEGGAPL